MKIYVTDAGLGHQQFAWLIRVNKSENGYNYLCIDTQNISEDSTEYTPGGVVKDLEDIYVVENDNTYGLTDKDILKHSPLHGSFLFNYFIEMEKLREKL